MSTTTAGKSWSDKLSDMMEKMAPLFDQEHLASVRDGLAGLMPLLIVGAFSLALARCPSSGTGDVASTLAADLVAVVAQG